MENRLLNIQLTNEVQPKITEMGGMDWVSIGDGDYKNLYPQYLIDLYNNSATHAAVVNATAAMIAGEDLMPEETENLQQFVELKKFLGGVNKTETAHELLVKLAFDLKLQGAYAINVVWSKDRTKIAALHHIPVEQVRVGKPVDGDVKEYYISADWSQYRKKEYTPERIAAFNLQDRREASQLLYAGVYSPALELYHTPDYVAGTNWIQIDNLTADFHLNNIANGFSGSYFINFANGIPTQEERKQIENQIVKKFSGANNAGKFVLTFSDDANSKPEILPIQVSNADKQYTVLNELCIQNIMISHRVTSPMLLGVKSEGQLGGRGELLQASELYHNTVIRPFQNIILKTFNKILRVNGISLGLSIKDVRPLSSVFDAETLKDVLTQDEIRAELGYEPLTTTSTGSTTDAISTISPLVATKVLDNMSVEEIRDLVGLVTTEEDKQAIREAKTQLKSENVLDDFLAEYGEEEDLDGWEMIDEEIADEEHEDFDFEYNLEKLELASTGRAYPNAKSEQDGESTQTHKTKYRVRYIYQEQAGLSRKSGQKREFCRKMEAANKVYRKEDILRMGKLAVNKGWGLNGADTYSIWKYKGGGNCHHKWVRRIYAQAGQKPSNADAIITTTKARSRGFTPPTNEQQVPVAPKNMPKNGFVNKKGY